ncbi:DUF402 domain-containing protein [Chloroflexota bacterium]
MKKLPSFKSGQTIVLRELWHGKIKRAIPLIVVQDRPEFSAFYSPQGTISKLCRAPDGTPLNIDNLIRSNWILADLVSDRYNSLRLKIPSAGYSIIIFWNASDNSHQLWYVNLEEPFRKTEIGYDTMDFFLDVLISPDFSEWRWDDEDELAEAVEAGLITPEKSSNLYTEGKKAVKWLQSGKSPFSGWENWQPDPSWPIPVLPDGWDVVE